MLDTNSSAVDTVNYLRFVLVLLFVICLIALFGYVLRKMGMTFLPLAVQTGRQKQVAILESTALDAKRRLSVIRWRGEDHLVLTGSEQDLLIASKEAKSTNVPQEGAVTSGKNRARNSPPTNCRSLFDQARCGDSDKVLLPTSSKNGKGA